MFSAGGRAVPAVPRSPGGGARLAVARDGHRQLLVAGTAVVIHPAHKVHQGLIARQIQEEVTVIRLGVKDVCTVQPVLLVFHDDSDTEVVLLHAVFPIHLVGGG